MPQLYNYKNLAFIKVRQFYQKYVLHILYPLVFVIQKYLRISCLKVLKYQFYFWDPYLKVYSPNSAVLVHSTNEGMHG